MNEILQIIGALGIGGLLSSYLTLLWKNRQEDKRKHQDYKEARYKCIIMLLHAKLNFEKNQKVLNQYGYNVTNISDLDDLLEAELVNSYLFASANFIEALGGFIKSPSETTRILVAKAMRKDLWRLKQHALPQNQPQNFTEALSINRYSWGSRTKRFSCTVTDTGVSMVKPAFSSQAPFSRIKEVVGLPLLPWFLRL